jgi:hypothetical protein
MSRLTLIDLSPIPMTCIICDAEFVSSRSENTYGVARYEDDVVPDDYKGEWGGAPACPTCYWVERGLHAAQPSAFIPFATIRNIVKGSAE